MTSSPAASSAGTSAPGVSPLPRVAWPGAYPILYIQTAEAVELCPDCAWTAVCNDEPVEQDVYWEGPPVPCADCGEPIESAYGEP